ncbi:MAG TPA: hypothetical protein VIW21_13695, partial [Chthoniobacterales bacterium]
AYRRANRLPVGLQWFRLTIPNPTGENSAFQLEAFEKKHVKLSLFVRELHLLRICNVNSFLPNDCAVQEPTTGTFHNVNGSNVRNRLTGSLIDVPRCFCPRTAKLTHDHEAATQDVLQ